MMSLLAQQRPNIFQSEWWTDKLVTKDEPWQLLPPLMVTTIGAVLTLGIYSLLYRENRFYRLVEHIFVGLAAGWSVVLAWRDVLSRQWYEPMMGRPPSEYMPMVVGHWAWAVLLPIGFLGLFVFSRKQAWLSRIPIGIILGLWAGQQFSAFQEEFLPQLAATAKPIVPNAWSLVHPGMPPGTLTWSQALSNLILVLTFLVVLSYFLYSFEQKSKIAQRSALYGRWLLMVGLGAIFGTTMMTRFVLFIDRAYYLLVQWAGFGQQM